MTTETLDNGLKLFKEDSHSKEVASYYDGLQQDVAKELLKIAKGINKNIAVIDWTVDDPSPIIERYRHNKEYLIFFLPNVDKDSKAEHTLFRTVLNGAEVTEAIHLERQYNSLSDEWHLFQKDQETLFHDDNDIKLAASTRNYLRMFVDVVHMSIYDRKLFMASFQAQFIKFYADLPDTDKTTINRMVRDFQTFVKNGQENLKYSTRSRLQQAQDEMSNHYRAIQRQEKTIQEATILLRSLGRKYSAFNSEFNADKLGNVFESFIKKDMYTVIRYGSSIIQADTGDIYCENLGKKYLIGKFRVSINLDGTVRMRNLTNRHDSYDHPHIAEEIPCLGNIKDTVPKMIFNGDFIGILNLLHNYLSTYNPQGPYIQLEAGWGTPEDWCSRCDNPRLACQCNNCPECGEPQDNCTCERCPRYGSLMETVDCSSCDYWDEEAENCTY